MLDRITVSVVQHRFVAIVAEMGEAMLRTAYSQILNSSRDFSTALCDGQGRLVAQAEHVPIHVGGLPWAVRAVIEDFEGGIRPGDLFLLNDPYHGGNHLPDLTVLLPVFAHGHLAFWSINRAHQSDIGGSTHGAYNPAATEIWQEGIRIPPLKLYDAGDLREDVMQMIAANVRHAQDFLGDLRASIGSARLGERRLLRLVDEAGVDTVAAAVGEILDSTERQTRACIRAWKDGVYRGMAVLDDDGHGATDIAIRATVHKAGDQLTVDLTQSDPQVEGFVNSSYPNTMSAVHMALAYLIDTRSLTQESAEAVIKALARACPERAIAGWGGRFRISIRGVDPRTRRPFIWHMFHARPGGGASAAGDGWPSAGEGQAAGGIKFGSVEVTEVRFPLFLGRHEFRPGSGGAGRFRGGVGSILEMKMETAEPARANTAGDGVRHAPYGLFGGKDGLPHRYRLVSRSGSRWLATKEVGIPVRPGDVFLVESSGGGGYGDPAEREPAARAADLDNGFILGRRARAVNGPRRRRR